MLCCSLIQCHWITQLYNVCDDESKTQFRQIPELSLDFVHNKTCRAVNPGTVLNQPFKDIIKITLLYQYCIVRKLYGKDKI